MKLEIARQVEQEARQDKRITAEIIKRCGGYRMRLVLRARHIAPRTLTIHTERDWQAVKDAWEGL